jgi:hypothetical protein
MLARHKEEVFQWISERADDVSEEEGEDADEDEEMKD